MDGVRNYPGPDDPEKMGKPGVIDEMAKEGVEFTQATTSATSTLMSVTAMMTSIPSYYLSRNLADLRLDSKYFESLGAILEQEGYHVYNVNMSYAMRRGYWQKFLRPVDRKYWPKGCKAMEHWRNDPINPIIFRLLEDGIEAPFFLYVHYNARRDVECGEKVSELITRLKIEGLYEDSIIVMCSDHGLPDTGRRDYYSWLNEKGFFYNRHDLIMTDDNICIPLVFKYPGCPEGKKIPVTVGSIDIVPTILDLIKIPHGENAKYGKSFRGVSLVPLIADKDVEYYASRKIRTDARYISQKDRMISIRGTGYKYVYLRDVPSDEKEQFYDLSKDPLESNNLINTKDPFRLDIIKDYIAEYNRQEQDAIFFQREFLCQRAKVNLGKNRKGLSSSEHLKILFLGTANPAFFEMAYDIITNIYDSAKVDIFVERYNILPDEEMAKIGYTNIVLMPHQFDFKVFKEKFKFLLEDYDLCITPVTDYVRDAEQAINKSTKGDMQIIQAQKPIDNQLIGDYKEIFKIVNGIEAREKLYIDYNFNVVKNPRFFLVSKYLTKMIMKRDIYRSRPFEIFRDIKRVLGPCGKPRFNGLSKGPLASNNLISTKDLLYLEKSEYYLNENNRKELGTSAHKKDFFLKMTKVNFKKNIKGLSSREHLKILFLGTANPTFFELAYDIISNIYDSAKVDIFVERHNLLSNEEMTKIGYRNIIIMPYQFNIKIFKEKFKFLLEDYDLCITPVTDYMRDAEQVIDKPTKGDMQIMQSQKPIDNQLISDYKEIFKIVNGIKAKEKLYVDYNFNVVKNHSFVFVSGYLTKMVMKRDMYKSKPFEMFRNNEENFVA